MASKSTVDDTAIEQAIAAAEARTAAELVVMVVPRSDDYARGRAVLAGVVAVVVVVAVDWAWPWIAQAAPGLARVLPLDPLAWLLPLQALLFAGAWWLGGRLPARWLASDARLTEAVQRRAKQAFFDQRISHTRDRSGVLLLLSEQEHRVVILADRGVDALLGPEAWAGWVAKVSQGMARGEGSAVLCRVIGEIGDALAERFPPRPDDEDELADRVAREP
jgi:putative membrane protein